MKTETLNRPKPAVLLILDGFGVAPDSDGNAITRAKMPAFRELIKKYPTMTLRASGEEVGLSWGEMGNSEVGHLAIGSGRVYYQMFPRINREIASESFFQNSAFLEAAEYVKKQKSTLHLIGMVSPGRVHSMDEHCFALLEFARRQKIKDVAIHAILDGRDTVYNAGVDFLATLQKKIKELKIGKIATLSGRYYAMDRDNRWDRTEKAYLAMALGEGQKAEDPIEALRASYGKEVYDEEFVPTVIEEKGKPIAFVKERDAVIFFNFRPDRMRQIVKAFTIPKFDGFERTLIPDLKVVTMAEYEPNLPVTVAFQPEKIKLTLAEVISNAGLKQLHIAETEKYAHVTFFLNGMREEPFLREDRVIIPSPKVSSYDTAPEMSAQKITDRVLKEIENDSYDFIVVNFANPDMVAHTGNFEATVKANEVTDGCLSKIVKAAVSRGGVVFVTADHGNAEELKNLRTGEIDKEHATNPVPFLLIGKMFEGRASVAGEIPEGDLSLSPPVGMLADVAPTILTVLGIPQPPEMGGAPLV